jgi:hypothetical protein
MEMRRQLRPSTVLLQRKSTRRLSGLQSRYGRCEISKKLLPLSGIEPRPSSLSLYRRLNYLATRYSAVILQFYATSRKVAGSIPNEVTGFFQFTYPSSRAMTLPSTRPLTEMSTRNLPGGKGRPARGADNLTAIREPIIYKMWEPRRLTNLWASTTCYRDIFAFF